MDNYDVVRKLIGEIRPVGETNEDINRYENLKAMCELMDKIDTAIKDVAWDFKNRSEYSIKQSVKYAEDFLKGVGSAD